LSTISMTEDEISAFFKLNEIESVMNVPVEMISGEVKFSID